MWNVTEIVLPVFLLIGLGYTVRRLELVDDLFFQQANKLVFYLCLPLLLIYKIGSADFSASFNISLVIATSGAVAFCFVLSYGYGRWRRYSPRAHSAFCQGSFRGNLAYIGLAIVYNAYGDAGLTRAGILLGFLVPVLNFFAILALTLPRQDRHLSFRNISTQIIVNPLILASLAGIFWSYFHLPMPILLDRTFSIATAMTLPLALLCIGGSFSLAELRGDLHKAALATVSKLALMPLVTLGFMLLLGITGMDLALGLLMAGTPTAVATYIMASQMDADARLAGTIVVMTTGLSIVSYTVILFFIHGHGL